MAKRNDIDDDRSRIPVDPANRWIPVDPATLGPERVLSPNWELVKRLGLDPDQLGDDLESPALTEILAALDAKYDEEALERGRALLEELKRSIERDAAEKEAFERIVRENIEEAIERGGREALSKLTREDGSRLMRGEKYSGDRIEEFKALVLEERAAHPDRPSDTLAIRKVAKLLNMTPESLSRLLRRRAPGFIRSRRS